MKKVIEQQIRELLTLNVSSATLSNILFSQFGGLFGQLASSADEREAVSRSSLFRQALARVQELADREAAPLRAEVDLVNAALARGKAKVQAASANGPANTGLALKTVDAER